MASLSDLPTEILLAIAATPQAVAALARTSRRLYDVFNPELYAHHISHCRPAKSCIVWGARKGRLGTVKLGHQHGGSVNLDIKDTNWPECGTVESRSGDSWNYLTHLGTPIQLAVRYGHPDIVAYLLEHGADVHAPSPACCHCDGMDFLSYPLHEVVCKTPSRLKHCRDRNRDGAVAIDLMQHGAYLQGPDRPVLHPLIMQDRMDLIAPLVEHYGSGSWAGALSHSTPLHVAGEFGRTGIARVMLARGDISLDALDIAKRTAAEKAAQGGHISTLKVLLDADAGPDGRVRALHAAAASGQPGVVKVLLDEYGVPASERDTRGDTALHIAAKAGHLSVVELLVGRADLDVNATCPLGMAAIHCAASEGHQESAVPIIQALAHAGADVNACASPPDGAPVCLPLRYAIERHSPLIALALLSLGADPSLEKGPDPRTGQSLLHVCLTREDEYLTKTEARLVKELIGKGADIESMPEPGTSVFRTYAEGPPVFYAAAHAKSDACLQALLEAGASVDLPRIDVYTRPVLPETFLMAVFHCRFASGVPGNVERVPRDVRLGDVKPVEACVKMLLQHGARLDGGFPGSQSALEYACEVAMDRDGCFELLCVLLRGSTRRNVSLEHLEAVKARYELGHGLSEDRETVQLRRRVFRQLSDFGKKAFKQRKEC